LGQHRARKGVGEGRGGVEGEKEEGGERLTPLQTDSIQLPLAHTPPHRVSRPQAAADSGVVPESAYEDGAPQAAAAARDDAPDAAAAKVAEAKPAVSSKEYGKVVFPSHLVVPHHAPGCTILCLLLARLAPVPGPLPGPLAWYHASL